VLGQLLHEMERVAAADDEVGAELLDIAAQFVKLTRQRPPVTTTELADPGDEGLPVHRPMLLQQDHQEKDDRDDEGDDGDGAGVQSTNQPSAKQATASHPANGAHTDGCVPWT